MDTSEIVLGSEADANAVLEAMNGLLKNYEIVSFADMLDLVGIASNFNDARIGWTTLEGVQVKPSKGGFILDLPPTKSLD